MLILFVLAIILLLVLRRARRASQRTVGFFHPYSGNGGGGERVLWVLLETLVTHHHLKSWKFCIYDGGGLPKDALLRRIEKQFSIQFNNSQKERIVIVPIRSRFLLEAKWYPVATMLFQSAGSMVVGLECLCRYSPSVFCDTMGAAFVYPLARLFGSRVFAYVHYPIISSDMMNAVRQQRPSYNNDQRISSDIRISKMKLWYYEWFARLYAFVGSFAEVVMVNGSWTERHIAQIWQRNSSKSVYKVFPPCNVTHLLSIDVTGEREKTVLSVGQFRPEKDHQLQLDAFEQLLRKDQEKFADVRLVMLGSTRGAEDEELVGRLRSFIGQHKLEDRVELIVNAPYSELLMWLGRASIGLHTMWNEHFGISVVEMMAAGLLVVAHDSGGPSLDIIEADKTGYLASSAEGYVEKIETALEVMKDKGKCVAMRDAARKSVGRFSDEQFSRQCVDIFVSHLKKS